MMATAYTLIFLVTLALAVAGILVAVNSNRREPAPVKSDDEQAGEEPVAYQDNSSGAPSVLDEERPPCGY